jgi:hypothetical protein
MNMTMPMTVTVTVTMTTTHYATHKALMRQSRFRFMFSSGFWLSTGLRLNNLILWTNKTLQGVRTTSKQASLI